MIPVARTLPVLAGQPGKPKPLGNPPRRPEPDETPPVEEPPSPIPTLLRQRAMNRHLCVLLGPWQSSCLCCHRIAIEPDHDISCGNSGKLVTICDIS
jgi:hypothetical protein